MVVRQKNKKEKKENHFELSNKKLGTWLSGLRRLFAKQKHKNFVS